MRKENRIILRGLLLLCVMVFILSGCSRRKRAESAEVEQGCKTPISSSEAKGKDYEEIAEAFKNKGFQNIEFEKDEDLITGWMTKDGSIESISINGDDDFKAGEIYDEKVTVIIKYHTFPEREEKPEESAPEEQSDDEPPSSVNVGNEPLKEGECRVPISSKNAKKKNYQDMVEAFTNSGFTNIQLEKDEDLITGWVTKDGSVESITVDGDYEYEEGAMYNVNFLHGLH